MWDNVLTLSIQYSDRQLQVNLLIIEYPTFISNLYNNKRNNTKHLAVVFYSDRTVVHPPFNERSQAFQQIHHYVHDYNEVWCFCGSVHWTLASLYMSWSHSITEIWDELSMLCINTLRSWHCFLLYKQRSTIFLRLSALYNYKFSYFRTMLVFFNNQYSV